MLGQGGTINFPKLSPSPTHPPRTHHLPTIPGGQIGRIRSDRLPSLPGTSHQRTTTCGVTTNNPEEDYISAPRIEPLSFEQALAMGRGVGGMGRQLPSPMPNGFKPGQSSNLEPQLSGGERRLIDRPSLSQRTMSNRVIQQHAEEDHSDSDADDWC